LSIIFGLTGGKVEINVSEMFFRGTFLPLHEKNMQQCGPNLFLKRSEKSVAIQQMIHMLVKKLRKTGSVLTQYADACGGGGGV
jgi:hypothetical protein